MFKVCLIGCGEIAKNFHGPAIQKYFGEHSNEINLLACCDTDIQKAKAFAEKFGFKSHYDDYRKMLNAERPDAVCLTASYVVIHSIAVDVMGMGIPIIMEKPPGTTGAEVSTIIEAADKSKIHNQVAFNRRYTPIVNELKSILSSSGPADDIYNIRCVFQRVGRRDDDFYTTAIHGIDTVKYIAGSDYKQVRFRYQELPEVNKGAANIYLDCEMQSGATAQLAFCPFGGKVIEDYFVTCSNHDFTLKMPVWGSPEYPGGLWHFSGNECVNHVKGDDTRFGIEMFERFGFYSENADFFNNVRAKVQSPNDINSALQSVEIAYCIHQRLEEYNSI